MIKLLKAAWPAMLAAACLPRLAQGQGADGHAGAKILARVSGDSVLLRWAPATPLAWQLGNRHGYAVERIAVDGGKTEKTWAARPLPLAGWEGISQREKLAAVAAQAIYGETFEARGFSGTGEKLSGRFAEMENRHAFALAVAGRSFAVAKASGLGIVDTAIEPGKAYAYRVWHNLPYNAGLTPDTAAVYVDTGLVFEPPPVVGLEADFGDMRAALSWPTHYHRGIYDAYRIERSLDGGESFLAATPLPYANTWKTGGPKPRKAYFNDTLQANGVQYCFRVRGLTPFGELGPPSEIACGEGVAGFAQPEIDSARVVGGDTAKLRWRFPKDMENVIAGFRVLRSGSANGPFAAATPVTLPPATRAYTDKGGGMESYYQVVAVGKNGKSASSNPAYAPKEDNTPPAAPTGLRGHVDSLGVVSLSWETGEDTDLLGYKVYKANRPGAEYVAASPEILTKAEFTDTLGLNTLTRDIHYRVVAVDRRWNKSGYSRAARLRRPDRSPPAPVPILNAFAREDGAFCLEWGESPSKDIARVVLLKAGAKLETLATFHPSGGVKGHCDESPANGGCSYMLYARDSAGNRSEMTVFRMERPARPANAIALKAEPGEDGVLLAWGRPKKAVRAYRVYKYTGGRPRLAATLGGDAAQYLDRGAKPGNAYRYKIRARFADGTESAFGDGATIEY